ncbi:MAG: VOC family protein, partial [Deltaproteobacteria bacterium]|nr:VOC family protein [Deltaproteobacteria bacterium]
MKILCVDHIGIAAESMDGSVNFYTQVLGLEATGIEEVAEQKVRTSFLPVGES